MSRIELEEAVRQFTDRVAVTDAVEECTPAEAGRRILAEEIRAGFDQPPFPRSPLDGYALIAADTAGASEQNPVTLRVIDKIMAGTASEKTVVPGTAVRLMTGAPIPAGADCVIRQEDTDYEREPEKEPEKEPAGEPGTVRIYTALKPHDNICDAGDDFTKGALLAAKGEKLDYISQALLASAGVTSVRVFRKLRAAVFTSGDELVMPGQALRPGRIYDSNRTLVSSRLKEWGLDVICGESVVDDPEVMGRAIAGVIDEADLVITTGGVSVGEKDIMHETVDRLGADRLFWGVAVKPGAPTIGAMYRGKPLICLTGNPYGVLVNLELLAGPVIAHMSRDTSIRPAPIMAPAAEEYPKTGGVRRLVRAVYAEGRVTIPVRGQMSGVLGSMRGCNCLADIGSEVQGIRKGDLLRIWLLK